MATEILAEERRIFNIQIRVFPKTKVSFRNI
jgi:hypothetical protein